MDKEKSIVLIAIVIAVVIGVSLQFSQSQKQSTNVNASGNNEFNPGNSSNENSPTKESTSAPSSNQPNTNNSNTTETNQTKTQELGITITSPANFSTVSTATITVAGKTSPNAEVFINDKTLRADNSGNFSTSLTLDEGENIIGIAANDSNGDFVEKELTVTYQP